jgi:hypothetical protein|tara:strand:- start:645 stop:797 length:153 start_codon:yes stop_codon:yes gene_type:complete
MKKEITKIEGKPVCIDCHCVMFRKLYKGADTVIEGWGCPECHTTRWDEVK